jgi:integrase
MKARESLAELANFGIAKSTWSSYRTAERMLMKCQQETKTDFMLPISRDNVLVFIDWLVRVRNVRGSTINSYISGIRQLHISRGMEPPNIRDGFVNLVIKGKMNKDAVEKRSGSKRTRLPVTQNVMLLLKKLIRQWEKPIMEKLLIWCVCTLAFAGSFRIGEILCGREGQFDPDFTLLTEDVTERLSEGNRTLCVRLKCPKETKTAAPTIVDVFESKGQLCPVKAWSRWRERAKVQTGSPLFKLESGVPLTGRKLNNYLKILLEPYIDYNKGSITTHSFRAGIPSLLAAAGHETEDIKKVGRWSSNAVERYIKLERTKRASIAKKISELDKQEDIK